MNCNIFDSVSRTLDISYRGSSWHDVAKSELENPGCSNIFEDFYCKNNLNLKKLGKTFVIWNRKDSDSIHVNPNHVDSNWHIPGWFEKHWINQWFRQYSLIRKMLSHQIPAPWPFLHMENKVTLHQNHMTHPHKSWYLKSRWPRFRSKFIRLFFVGFIWLIKRQVLQNKILCEKE